MAVKASDLCANNGKVLGFLRFQHKVGGRGLHLQKTVVCHGERWQVNDEFMIDTPDGVILFIHFV